MQGHMSSVSTLPENLSFDHGSTSSDAGVDSQMSWNSMPSETNIQYLHHGLGGEWSLGESSSSAAQTQLDPDERKREHAWSFHPRTALNLEEPSNILSLNNAEVNANSNQTTNGLQITGPGALPQDLNIGTGFGGNEDDDCQVVERPDSYMPSTGGSSGSYAMESENGAGCSLDGQRMSCKRKAMEVHVGQSSGAGSSTCLNHAERSQWPASQNAASSINMSMQTDNNLVDNSGPQMAIPRLMLGVGGGSSSSPFSLPARVPAESSRRNFRLRINGAHQQDQIPSGPFLPESGAVNADISSSRNSSNTVLLDHLRPAQNGSFHGQSELLNVPSVRHIHQSRWNEASSSRTSSSSTSAIERDAMVYESLTRNIPRSISGHPMFVPATERGSSPSHQNYNLAGSSDNFPGNVPSTSRAGSNAGLNRACPQYPRRLSEIVRRSLLSSAGDTEPGGQNRNYGVRLGSSATSQEMALSSGSGSHSQHRSSSRAALLERHLDGAIPIPYSLRTLAAAGEGRSSIMSEIRHVLDLMRRGEGLRFEDVLMLDHSVFVGMADIHDRHRDMRLDVDNMSYEELLALGERIGNVCTGLNEETIMNRLKVQKYVDSKSEDQVEKEPCSICREDYNDGEDLGTLECGHDFHTDCIKQWLMQKNLCPICKTTGLTT